MDVPLMSPIARIVLLMLASWLLEAPCRSTLLDIRLDEEVEA